MTNAPEVIQQIAHRITITKARAPIAVKSDNWQDTATQWLYKLPNGETGDYYTGSGIKTKPTGLDILASLSNDAQAAECSFEDFCDNYGYSNDSLKALDIYRACALNAKKLKNIGSFGGYKLDLNQLAEWAEEL